MGHAFDCRNHLWPRKGHARGRKWWDAGQYDKGALHAVPLAGDKAPALHFLPPASAVNPRLGEFGVWGGALEVDRSAYSRSNRMCRLPSTIGAAHASPGFWPSPGLRPEWADRIVWSSRAKYCQVFIEEVGRLPD